MGTGQFAMELACAFGFNTKDGKPCLVTVAKKGIILRWKWLVIQLLVRQWAFPLLVNSKELQQDLGVSSLSRLFGMNQYGQTVFLRASLP